MLIKALSDYYGVIEKQGKILDDAYSSVGISYLVSLTEDGKMDGIIDCEDARQIKKKNKKGEEVIETKKFPRSMILPKRIESTSVNAYIVDHRPAYIFGLTCKNEALTEDSSNDKTRKSHADFVRKNEEFFRDMRLKPQFDMADHYFSSGDRKQIEMLLNEKRHLEVLLRQEREKRRG